MRQITLTEPLRITSLSEPTRFIVESLFDGPALTIDGRNFQGRWSQLPRIELVCQFRGGGIKLERMDNCVADSIVVDRSLGTAVDISTGRQSHFRSIQVTECEADQAVRIRCQHRTGDAPNACRFDYLSVYACKAQECLALEGNGTEVGKVRRLQLGMVFLHGCWPKQLEAMPEPERSRFSKHQIGTMLAIRNADRIGFERLAITCDQDTENVFAVDKSQRIAIAGDALVHRADQVQIGNWARDNGFDVVVRR